MYAEEIEIAWRYAVEVAPDAVGSLVAASEIFDWSSTLRIAYQSDTDTFRLIGTRTDFEDAVATLIGTGNITERRRFATLATEISSELDETDEDRKHNAQWN